MVGSYGQLGIRRRNLKCSCAVCTNKNQTIQYIAQCTLQTNAFREELESVGYTKITTRFCRVTKETPSKLITYDITRRPSLQRILLNRQCADFLTQILFYQLLFDFYLLVLCYAVLF